MWRFRCAGSLRSSNALYGLLAHRAFESAARFPTLGSLVWNRCRWRAVEGVAAANGPHEQPIRNEEYVHGNA
jgi:hypothetical protein